MVIPIVLAAGDSRRMGYPKALLPLGQETFLTRILATLEEARLMNPIVVLGKHAGLVRRTLSGLKAQVVVNSHPELGQLASLRLALDRVDAGADGCLVWPVDHPAVSRGLVVELIRLFAGNPSTLVLPWHQGRRGHPAVFPRSLFPELFALPTGEGAKHVVLRHTEQTILLPTSETATIEDVDTPEDYYRLTGEELAAALARRESFAFPAEDARP
jgi:molybdenum cofactor cytidylyltransferase